MKNKPTRHKELNTFKFIPFSERITNIDVDIFHKVGHEYETQTEESQSYFYQAIDKWNVLNLSEGYESFRKEIRAGNYITLPQVLYSKDHIVEVLIKHLKLKNPLCLQPLLEIVVAVAKDLQKEFYQYYPQLLEVLIELLNTKDAEQLEWTFTCLAYLFKFLWRSLVKDINKVFNTLLPLLSDNKPEYINSFAAESFAFVARKVRDKKSFLSLLLKAVKNKQDGVVGCGKLLFHVLNGVEGQFHSSAETMLPFLFESLFDEKLPQSVLFEVLEQVIANIVFNIKPQKSQLLWTTFIRILDELTEGFKTKPNETTLTNLEFILKLLVPLIQSLIRLFNLTELKESVLLIVVQIAIVLLLSKGIKIPQEHTSGLIRKILLLPHKTLFLFFVENIAGYTSFDVLVLPSFLKYCVKSELEADCFKVLTDLVSKKSPSCFSGIGLENWKKYPLDFREGNLKIVDILTSYITPTEASKLYERDVINYCSSLVCLPHVACKENNYIRAQLRRNVNILIDRIKISAVMKDEEIGVKKLLYLLNCTVECLIHLNEDALADIFTKMLDCLLNLAQHPQYVISLKILSLCLTVLKDNSCVITMEKLKSVNKALENNFNSPFHEVRLLTSHIYSFFDNLAEFKLKYSTNPDAKEEKWRVFSICYAVEAMEPQVDTYRNQLQNLEKFYYDQPQMLMCIQTDFKTIPLRYLCGALYINFQLLWEPVTKIIASHAGGLDINVFWGVFGKELKNVCDNIRHPKEIDVYELDDRKCDALADKVKPDFSNYRLLLWKAMSMFPDIAEAKTRDVSELVLEFIALEYISSNSDAALSCSIKQNAVKEANEESSDRNEEMELNTTRPKGRAVTRTLLQKLKVLSQVRSPMSMYREPDLYKLYFDLLQHKNGDIQKSALDCIMTYKHKYLTPYKQNLYNLVDDKNFKNEITTFRVDKESDMIVQEHRENLIPVIMQIVFSKMNVKTGLRTGGKASSQTRRNLVFRFLAGCEEKEMLRFLEKAFRFYNKYLVEDAEILVSSIIQDLDLERFIPPKRLQSTINLLNVILEQFGGLMGEGLLTYFLKIVLVVGAVVKGAFDKTEQVHAGFLSVLRTIRTSCIKIIGRFFEQFDRYPWTNKQVNAVFTVFVWPYLPKLNVEGIHSPTSLLKLFAQWGSNPKYFPLLVKHQQGNREHYVLPHVVQLLLNEKSHVTVVNTIEEMLEKMLSLQPDEEDLQLQIPIDDLLPVQDDILAKVGLVNQLNYGSCILLPQVPLILNKIKKKLTGKYKNLNQRELFILSRISELVWEPDISDTILQLLLPVVLKKCATSGEEIVSKYLTSILNLIKNVEAPHIHLKEVSPLFAEISFASCRKILTQILEIVAAKSNDEDIKLASDLVLELNAWDSRWIDQPDFEKKTRRF
ncbi:hypothetical protein NQ315_004373 [Exocentrus adspersus]|uniref:U3 small nucleolar RNA-associated protein 20 N-terminal domain-containing protein n=1 Tax=Exocentrus adspersus TaxID=1586481 RepID=A0AAV8W724_9CUCU|nr:hypothetical protein NQ315_004373 [Exocentrus adspersus]